MPLPTGLPCAELDDTAPGTRTASSLLTVLTAKKSRISLICSLTVNGFLAKLVRKLHCQPCCQVPVPLSDLFQSPQTHLLRYRATGSALLVRRSLRKPAKLNCGSSLGPCPSPSAPPSPPPPLAPSPRRRGVVDPASLGLWPGLALAAAGLVPALDTSCTRLTGPARVLPAAGVVVTVGRGRSLRLGAGGGVANGSNSSRPAAARRYSGVALTWPWPTPPPPVAARPDDELALVEVAVDDPAGAGVGAGVCPPSTSSPSVSGMAGSAGGLLGADGIEAARVGAGVAVAVAVTAPRAGAGVLLAVSDRTAAASGKLERRGGEAMTCVSGGRGAVEEGVEGDTDTVEEGGCEEGGLVGDIVVGVDADANAGAGLGVSRAVDTGSTAGDVACSAAVTSSPALPPAATPSSSVTARADAPSCTGAGRGGEARSTTAGSVSVELMCPTLCPLSNGPTRRWCILACVLACCVMRARLQPMLEEMVYVSVCEGV